MLHIIVFYVALHKLLMPCVVCTELQ